MTDERDQDPREHGEDALMSLAEDRALLRAWCSGDKAAGERLIRYQFDWVSRAVLRWVHGDAAVAMDIVQATFEVALKKKAEIHGPFGPYVRGIARVKVLEHFRSKEAVVNELTSSLCESATGAESALLGAEQEHVAVRALQQLPAEQQELMYLRYVQGMKLREIAELKGETTNKIAGVLKRAEERLVREVERLAEAQGAGVATVVGVETWLRGRGDDESADERNE